jgi:predicted MFS family arabinose efflux permease
LAVLDRFTDTRGLVVTSTAIPDSPAQPKDRLPWSGLLALFGAGFLGIINETIPAGLLPEMARGLGVGEAAAGQTVTIYAIATALTAIGLTAALHRWSRRAVLVGALATFAVANAVTFTVDSFAVILVARFVAGVGAGLVWSTIGGYAARISPESLRSRAVTIALAGTPVALALGLPVGTLVGSIAGWQATFGLTALASVLVIGWAFVALPALANDDQHAVDFGAILRAPGVKPILVVVAGFVVAHNVLYTYIGPLAVAAHLGDQLVPLLLVFGVSALVSIWVTGIFVDPHHRRLMVASTVLLALSALVLGLATTSPGLLYTGVAGWGLGFGGAATLLVTAGLRASGADSVQAVIVTVWNIGIALGGAVGGLLLAGLGATSTPWIALALAAPTAVVVLLARRHAFPSWARDRP